MTHKEPSVGKKYVQYVLSRTFQESVRLHMQNWMFKERFGYLLHPAIPTSAHSLSLVDVGCGNGHWLLDVADNLPGNWMLHGLDIVSDSFPAKEYLPVNVFLSIRDVFEELPEHLVEKFDVVHIRAFGLVVKGGDPNHLCANLIRMLKPGGYLQWDEVDAHRAHFVAPNPMVSTLFTDKMFALWHHVTGKIGLSFRWPGNLAPILHKNHGLEIVAAHRYGPTNKLRKPATDDWTMGFDEFFCNMMRRDEDIAKEVEPENYCALMEGVADELMHGVTIWCDLMVVVAQKPKLRAAKL